MVAPTSAIGPNVQRKNAAVATAPAHCAATYCTTSRAGKRPIDQKPMVTAGLIWAPDRRPVDATQRVMTRPNASAMPTCPNAWVFAATMIEPGPMATSANVPIISATYRRTALGAALLRRSPSRARERWRAAGAKMIREFVRQRAFENAARRTRDVVVDSDDLDLDVRSVNFDG